MTKLADILNEYYEVEGLKVADHIMGICNELNKDDLYA